MRDRRVRIELQALGVPTGNISDRITDIPQRVSGMAARTISAAGQLGLEGRDASSKSLPRKLDDSEEARPPAPLPRPPTTLAAQQPKPNMPSL